MNHDEQAQIECETYTGAPLLSLWRRCVDIFGLWIEERFPALLERDALVLATIRHSLVAVPYEPLAAKPGFDIHAYTVYTAPGLVKPSAIATINACLNGSGSYAVASDPVLPANVGQLTADSLRGTIPMPQGGNLASMAGRLLYRGDSLAPGSK